VGIVEGNFRGMQGTQTQRNDLDTVVSGSGEERLLVFFLSFPTIREEQD
jgi:hypothetical protein